MKKYTIVIICIILICIIGGCEVNMIYDYRKYSDNIFEQLMDAIFSKDVDRLDMIFSANLIASDLSFRESEFQLFSYVDGDDITEYKLWSHPNVYKTKEKDYFRQEIESTYDFELQGKSYRLFFIYCVKDTFDSANEGIVSLYVIKAKDDTDLSFAYRGDEVPKDGIHIGVKNVLPKEIE